MTSEQQRTDYSFLHPRRPQDSAARGPSETSTFWISPQGAEVRKPLQLAMVHSKVSFGSVALQSLKDGMGPKFHGAHWRPLIGTMSQLPGFQVRW